MHLAEKARCTGFSCTFLYKLFLYKLFFFLYKLSLVLSALVPASLSAKGTESVCKKNISSRSPVEVTENVRVGSCILIFLIVIEPPRIK